jgi:hypothetical protein
MTTVILIFIGVAVVSGMLEWATRNFVFTLFFWIAALPASALIALELVLWLHPR